LKKLVLGLIIAAIAGLGIGAGSAHADPAGTLCGDVHVVVNGADVVNQATCQVLPPA
jgi:hypothetical protein